ncbi:hypothetical protein C1H46_028106 [Malus baccata]|uniref:Uncharacterized protein n=1 Tax=Malus baccata TaxID=106549 RepID=A0A540LIP2_MALBA|nr:hypothetical protein C1H46_028106 [Malus baccata]
MYFSKFKHRTNRENPIENRTAQTDHEDYTIRRRDIWGRRVHYIVWRQPSSSSNNNNNKAFSHYVGSAI